LFFFDESRFGTHSKLGYGWFPKGSRTRIPVKLGFQNFYVYTSLNPVSGESHSLIMPYVNTICMNVYLKHLSEFVGKGKAFLVMDGAGWHRSKTLVIPPNIQVVYLPPYSPELNPVERLWQYIKNNTIKNRIYGSLDSLEHAVSRSLVSLAPQLLINLSSCDYLYN
jgi:transposase